MKAVLFNAYGGSDVLAVGEVPDPVPNDGEVRIQIHAAGVNPVDCKIRLGLVQQRIPHVLPVIPGWDAAGIIDAVGPGVSRLKVGDAVYAYCRKPIVQFGAYAEYIVLPEEQVALKPEKASFEEAASIPLAALTAWQCLFDASSLHNGQSVLIHAGAGGVGGFAIQLAKNAGAFVIATASRKNHEYVKQLGADEVIDYTKIDFRDAVLAAHPKGVDVVFDTVGGEVQIKSADVVRKGGVLVSILAYQDEQTLKAKGIQTNYVFVSPNREQLDKLAELFAAGKFKTHITAVFSLPEAAQAHDMIESRRTVGKIVLRIRI
jgi:NADPH2:quinone reductase